MGLEQEVDLVRRRTTRGQRGRDTSGLASPREPRSGRRSLSSGSNNGGIVTLRDLADSGAARPRRRRSFSSISSMGEETEVGPLVLDEPYVQSQPRSQFSLHRAATVAANSPANRAHLRALPDRPLEYRRADGLREIPHESDADNWVPPPPPYSERPDPSGPSAVSIPNTSAPVVQVMLPQATQHPSQHITSDQDPLQPRLFQASTVTPQMSQLRSTGLGSNTTTPRAQPQLVSRGAVTAAQIQSENNTPQPSQAESLSNTTTLPRNLPNFAASRQPLHPPRPGALQTSFTVPATAHSPRPITRNPHVAPPPTITQQRSASSPASPVVTSMASLRGGVNATDFVPAVGLPTPEQMQSFHRRSSAGGFVPRAAMGAVGNDGRVSSAEPNRSLRPSTADNRDTVRHTSESNPRPPPMRERQDRRRPALTGLAAIASVVSRTAGGDTLQETLMQPTALPRSEPATPTGRRARWRTGPGRRTSQLANIETFERDRQTAPFNDQSQSLKAAPKRRGFKCIVM